MPRSSPTPRIGVWEDSGDIPFSRQGRRSTSARIAAKEMNQHRPGQPRLKRAIDLTIATVGLILLSPLILSIAVLVRITLGGPVLFAQTRPGYLGKPFRFYKFRTMTSATDERGQLLPDKYRLTACGKLLRRFSLDELPQLFNVLKGDMSLVGPRPLLMEYLPLYDTRQARRHEVKPGITGWTQVNGRNALTWEQKFDLDVWYVDNQSLSLDLRILSMTLLHIFHPKGISQGGHATMPKFTGTVRNRSDRGVGR